MNTPKTVSRWIGETMLTASSWYSGVTYNDKLYVNGKRVNAETFMLTMLKVSEDTMAEHREHVILNKQLTDDEVYELYTLNRSDKEHLAEHTSFPYGQKFNHRI